jgi:phage N-6-adenine-methyltransferase
VTLLNVRAKNHPQQVGRRGADDATDDRRTPREFWDQLNRRWGFTLDAAASAENALCPHFFTAETDGLRQSWSGTVWCNPPYSNVGAWVAKAWGEFSRCDAIVMLVPANRTEQRWWQENVEPFRDWRRCGLRVQFLKGRMRFDRPGWTKPAKGDRPPFGLCLLIWERAR